jgi:hypothetical protein
VLSPLMLIVIGVVPYPDRSSRLERFAEGTDPVASAFSISGRNLFSMVSRLEANILSDDFDAPGFASSLPAPLHFYEITLSYVSKLQAGFAFAH